MLFRDSRLRMESVPAFLKCEQAVAADSLFTGTLIKLFVPPDLKFWLTSCILEAMTS